MTPFGARLTVLFCLFLIGGVATNALYLQDDPRRLAEGPVTQVAITELTPLAVEASAPPAESQSLSLNKPADQSQRLSGAIARELRRKGYGPLQQGAAHSLTEAVLAYEYDSGLTLTGAISNALLKQLLFDAGQAPHGAFADRAELDGKLVLEVQRALLGLGFFSGSLNGRPDSWTEQALARYQAYRKLKPTGRLDEGTVLDLIAYAGVSLKKG